MTSYIEESVKPILLEVELPIKKVNMKALCCSGLMHLHMAKIMEKIDFFISPTDDVWVRDNGPIFVYDHHKNLNILDPGFNGWGMKTPFAQDALLRERISRELAMERIDWRILIFEGGAIDLDGNGTLLSTRIQRERMAVLGNNAVNVGVDLNDYFPVSMKKILAKVGK